MTLRLFMRRAVLVLFAAVLAVTSFNVEMVAALANERNKVNTENKIPDTSKVKPLENQTELKDKPAADVIPLAASGGTVGQDQSTPKEKLINNKDKKRLREDESKRTATSKTFINTDGTSTLES